MHLMTNHLFKNGRVLAFACYFDEADAMRWLTTGKSDTFNLVVIPLDQIL
jgi:hypothetical protein